MTFIRCPREYLRFESNRSIGWPSGGWLKPYRVKKPMHSVTGRFDENQVGHKKPSNRPSNRLAISSQTREAVISLS